MSERLDEKVKEMPWNVQDISRRGFVTFLRKWYNKCWLFEKRNMRRIMPEKWCKKRHTRKVVQEKAYRKGDARRGIPEGWCKKNCTGSMIIEIDRSF